MTKEIIEIIAGAGLGTITCVIIGYFWLKRIFLSDIVEPTIQPLKLKIEALEKNHGTISGSLEKIEENLSEITKSVSKLSVIFDILSKKIKIDFKE